MDSLTDDPRTLRRCVRDVVALSALSAVWGRTEPQGLAESLADVLWRTLQVDFVYVWVKGLADGASHEAVNTHRGLEPASRAREIGAALGPLLRCVNPDSLPAIDNPAGGGAVRPTVVPIGYEGDCGFLVAASTRPDFPGPLDRLLLGVGANQAAVVLQHKRAERALRQSHLRYRMVARAANDAIWDWDLATNQVTWNEGVQALFGYPAEEVGTDISWRYERIHPEDGRRVIAGIRAAIDGGKELWRDEYRHLRADGSYAYVFDRGFVVHDDGGKPFRMVGSMLDLTERRRLEESLREADRRKDEFLATLAHELRNPLAPIRNALEIMRLGGGDGLLVEGARGTIERQVQQMVRLVDDLLDIARISRDKLELRKERVALAAAVQSAVESSGPLIDSCGHRLTVALPAEPVYLDADLTRLSQVFLNLLNNAAKYTERGGDIRLTAECHGREIVVRVRDSGVGIPAEMLPRIFDMFTQVDQSMERSRGGLGIGLTLVRRLTEMHGGTVEVRSDGPGRGSEFIVRLPAAAERPGVEGAGAAEARTELPPLGKLRILIVDDNKDAANSLSLLLTMMGNETRTAHDGLGAVEAAAAFRPGVVLLDIGLPELNGYDAARQIRRQQGRDVVLIALTGWGQEEDRRLSKEAGFNHHMVKPVDLDALRRLLADLEPGSAGNP